MAINMSVSSSRPRLPVLRKSKPSPPMPTFVAIAPNRQSLCCPPPTPPKLVGPPKMAHVQAHVSRSDSHNSSVTTTRSRLERSLGEERVFDVDPLFLEKFDEEASKTGSNRVSFDFVFQYIAAKRGALAAPICSMLKVARQGCTGLEDFTAVPTDPMLTLLQAASIVDLRQSTDKWREAGILAERFARDAEAERSLMEFVKEVYDDDKSTILTLLNLDVDCDDLRSGDVDWIKLAKFLPNDSYRSIMYHFRSRANIFPILKGQYLAVLVWAGDEKNDGVVKASKRDVHKLAQVLLQLGFEVVVLDNPTARHLNERVKRMAQELVTDFDGAMFYFSGHGSEGRLHLEGTNTFAAQKIVDALCNRRDRSADLKLNRTVESKPRLFLTDCCRVKRKVASAFNLPKGTSRDYSEKLESKNLVMVHATSKRGTSLSSPDDKSSLFTEAIIDKLEYEAAEMWTVLIQACSDFELDDDSETQKPSIEGYWSKRFELFDREVMKKFKRKVPKDALKLDDSKLESSEAKDQS